MANELDTENPHTVGASRPIPDDLEAAAWVTIWAYTRRALGLPPAGRTDPLGLGRTRRTIKERSEIALDLVDELGLNHRPIRSNK